MMSAPVSVSLLQHCQNAIAVSQSGANPMAQREANEWLMQFERTKESWEVAQQLVCCEQLVGANEELGLPPTIHIPTLHFTFRFFGAKFLYSKVSKVHYV